MSLQQGEEAESNQRQYPPINLNFLIKQDNAQFSLSFPTNTNLSSICQELTDYLKQNHPTINHPITLEIDGNIVSDPHRTAESFSSAAVIVILPSLSSSSLPQVLKVNTSEEGEEANYIYVQIIRESGSNKPYQGGYRHKNTGKLLFHAASQTERLKSGEAKVKYSRDCQTVETAEMSVQSNREVATQMDRKDLYLSGASDRVLTAKPSIPGSEVLLQRERDSIVIQSFLRQCFAFRRVKRLKQQKENEIELEALELERVSALEAAEKQRQIDRRMNPRTKKDFSILYAELEAWRLHETARIKQLYYENSDGSSYSKHEMELALQELLAKEVKLLQTIDKLKIQAAKLNKVDNTKNELEIMASPKEWKSSEGDVVQVETPHTIRAKYLMQLYNALSLNKTNRNDRLDILLNVKNTVNEFPCPLTNEIIELIERELDLLRRQRAESSLAGLRLRLANRFLLWLKEPLFNPQATNFQMIQPGSQLAITLVNTNINNNNNNNKNKSLNTTTTILTRLNTAANANEATNSPDNDHNPSIPSGEQQQLSLV
jgi:hypothetical protein